MQSVSRNTCIDKFVHKLGAVPLLISVAYPSRGSHNFYFYLLTLLFLSPPPFFLPFLSCPSFQGFRDKNMTEMNNYE
jgi:hypothetical protein